MVSGWVWLVLILVAAVSAGIAWGVEETHRDGGRYEPRQLEVHHDRDFYGSMTLAGEREFYEDDEDPAAIWAAFDRAEHFLAAPPADRIEAGDDLDGEQTAAWFRELREDPGPGVEAVVPVDPPPGPVQFRNEAPDPSGGRRGAPGIATQGGDVAVSWPGGECASAPRPAPEPSRLADTDDIAQARGWPTVRDMDADVADWLAGRAVTWARLTIAEAVA